MDRKTAIVALVAGLLIFALAITVEAGPFGFGQNAGMGPGWGRLQFFLELKLTEAQQAEMTNIIERYRAAEEPLRWNAIEAGKNLRAIMQADPLDEEAARKAFRHLAALREEGFVLRAKMRDELKALLTPEQRVLMNESKARRIEKMKRRFAPLP